MSPSKKTNSKKSLKYKGEYEGAPPPSIDPVLTPDVEKTIAAGSQSTCDLLVSLAAEDFSRAEALALRLIDLSRPLRLVAIDTLAKSHSDRAIDALIGIIVEKKIWPEGSVSHIDGAWLQAYEALKHSTRLDLIERLLDRLSLPELEQMIADEAYLGNLWREMGITPEAHECRPYAIAMLLDTHLEQAIKDPRVMPILMAICKKHCLSDVRKAVVMVLLKIGDDEAINDLVETANYGLELALQELKDKDLAKAEYLAGKLITSRQHSLRVIAADILGQIASQESIEKLISVLDHPDGYNAVNALKSTANPSATQWLLTRLSMDSQDVPFTRYLMVAIAGRKDKAALPKLLEIWRNHSEVNMRKNAGNAIIELGNREGMEQLASLVEEDDLGIRWLAIKAVFGLGSEQAQKRFAQYLEPVEQAISNNVAVTIFEVLFDLVENRRSGFEYYNDLRWINIVIKLLKNGDTLKQAQRFTSIFPYRHKEQSLFEAVVKAAQFFTGQPRVATALVRLLPMVDQSQQRILIMNSLIKLSEPSMLKEFLAWSGSYQPVDDAEAKRIEAVIKHYS